MERGEIYIVVYPEHVHAGHAPTRVRVFEELAHAERFAEELLALGELSPEEVSIYACDLKTLECRELSR